jgi:hypothetical protein
MGLILIILLIFLLIGGVPFGAYQGGYGLHYGGGLSLVLVIVVIMILAGRI